MRSAFLLISTAATATTVTSSACAFAFTFASRLTRRSGGRGDAAHRHSASGRRLPGRTSRRSSRYVATVKMSTGTSPDDETEDEEEEEFVAPESVLDKINAALDAPLLDPNVYSDQGEISEALKEFVRGQPEVAQVVFSFVTFGVLFALGKIIVSLF
mmetsp:Transcript_36175/g.84582  ORF Transcript_36175/g.84582 Transcript_36175/m.84582 type:complete len:157 (-) Transcript_36175:434-904(-)